MSWTGGYFSSKISFSISLLSLSFLWRLVTTLSYCSVFLSLTSFTNLWRASFSSWVTMQLTGCRSYSLSKSNESFLRQDYKNRGVHNRCHCFSYEVFSVYPNQSDLGVSIPNKLLPLPKHCEPLWRITWCRFQINSIICCIIKTYQQISFLNKIYQNQPVFPLLTKLISSLL